MIVFSRGFIAPQLYRIVDIQGPIADLKPISLGGVPMQAPVSDLRRYRIRNTDQVRYGNNFVEVLRIVNPLSEDQYEYEVDIDGQEETAREKDLEVGEESLAPDPAWMLANLDLADWNMMDARQNLMEAFFDATSRSMGIIGYNGARMLPIPHQINAARYAIQFGRIRFLLADEVGLGKTVEAGLIVATLRKYFPSWQTAVFVPESLTAQWAFEMYGKFGKSVFALSEEDFDDDEAGIILAHHRAPEFAANHQPAILVVDEAHRILHDPEVLQAITSLSESAHAVLFLTATPVSDDTSNLLHLLQALDPEKFLRIDSAEALRILQTSQGKIEAVLNAIRTASPDPKAILKAWNNTGLQDPEITHHIREAQQDELGRHDLHRMASLITDRYYPGARILRYRRKFLAQDNTLPVRVVDPVVYTPMAEEAQVLVLVSDWLSLLSNHDLADDTSAQQVATALLQAAYSSPLALSDWLLLRNSELEERDDVTADPVLLARRANEEIPLLSGEESLLKKLEAANQKWFRATKAVDANARVLARSPRYLAFLEAIKEALSDEPDASLLVFTAFESNVHPLYLLLRKALEDVAEVFEMSGLMTRVEREKNAFEFQEFGGGSVLISDELGGEGRNFQFCARVIHFDLPPTPWTIEQRIGRCDRVGRDEEMDVESQVLVARGQLDEVIFDFLCEGVGVFNDSIAPIEGELDHVYRDMISSLIREGAGAIIDSMDEVTELLEEARDRENADLLVRSSVGVEEARRIAKNLDDSQELLALRQASIRYARLFESMVDEQDSGKVAITVGEHHSLHAMTGVSAEMVGYFDRRLAVGNERLNFFSPGHPFIRGLASETMADSPDRAAIVQRSGIKEPAILALFRVSIPPEFFHYVRQMEVDLRPPLLSRSAALFPTRMVRIAVALSGEVIPNTPENSAYYARARQSDKSLHNAGKVESLLPRRWRDSILAAATEAEANARDIASQHYAEKRPEFEDLACEVIARALPELEDAESLLHEIMEEIPELSVDMDSLCLLLPV